MLKSSISCIAPFSTAGKRRLEVEITIYIKVMTMQLSCFFLVFLQACISLDVRERGCDMQVNANTVIWHVS